MQCEVKVRLAEEYQTGVEKFAEAVSQLRHYIGISTKAEHERLQRASDEARIHSEHTRLAFEEHVAKHRC